jgi:hypothetical protein
MDKTYSPNPAYPVPAEAKEYVDSMAPKDRALHDLAIKLLGSSYFVEWSHGFKKWLAKQPKNP